MSAKLPPSTPTLVTRLRRVAKWIDRNTTEIGAGGASRRAKANVCWMAAGRLEDLAGLKAWKRPI